MNIFVRMHMQGTKARALAGDRGKRVQQVAGRAGKPVKARHHQHVTLIELVEGAAQLAAVGSRAACRLSKDLLGSGGARLLDLTVNALAIGRVSRVAVIHLAASSAAISARATANSGGRYSCTVFQTMDSTTLS